MAELRATPARLRPPTSRPNHECDLVANHPTAVYLLGAGVVEERT